MAGNDNGFIRQGEHAIVEGSDDLIEGATGQVSSSNAARKERVAGYEFLVSGKVDANASFCVSRRVHRKSLKSATMN